MEFLRDYASNDEEGQLASWNIRVDDAQRSNNLLEEISALGGRGTSFRLLGRLIEAESDFYRASVLSAQIGSKKHFLVNCLRLAITWQYQGKHNSCKLLLESLLVGQAVQASEYSDFILQHLGKCCVEQGQFGRGKAYLEAALREREIKGNPELILSTQTALHHLSLMTAQP
jgi:hypothetical protein